MKKFGKRQIQLGLISTWDVFKFKFYLNNQIALPRLISTWDVFKYDEIAEKIIEMGV